MKGRVFWGLAAGAVAGGIAGFFLGPVSAAGIWVSTTVGILVGAVAGALMAFLIRVFAQAKEDEQRTEETTDAASAASDEGGKVLLREERLDIGKERVKTGEVHVRRERIEEERTIKIPVVREEVVIESKVGTGPDAKSKTIRIPVKEERIEVRKHAFVTGDVKVYKEQHETTEEVKETLHKEVASIDVEGQADVVEEHTQAPH